MHTFQALTSKAIKKLEKYLIIYQVGGLLEVVEIGANNITLFSEIY